MAERQFIACGCYSGEGVVQKCLFTVTGLVMDQLENLKTPISSEILFELKLIFRDIFNMAVDLLEEPDAVIIYACKISAKMRYIVAVKHSQKMHYILRNVNLCQCQVYLGNGIKGSKVMCSHVLAARLAFLIRKEPVVVDEKCFSELVVNFTKPRRFVM